MDGIPKKVVLAVLVAHGISVTETEGGLTLIENDAGFCEKHDLPDRIHRRFLGRLAEKLHIPIHHFFHPEVLNLNPTSWLN